MSAGSGGRPGSCATVAHLASTTGCVGMRVSSTAVAAPIVAGGARAGRSSPRNDQHATPFSSPMARASAVAVCRSATVVALSWANGPVVDCAQFDNASASKTADLTTGAPAPTLHLPPDGPWLAHRPRPVPCAQPAGLASLEFQPCCRLGGR